MTQWTQQRLLEVEKALKETKDQLQAGEINKAYESARFMYAMAGDVWRHMEVEYHVNAKGKR